jgi:ankyrin repeat protein
MPGAEDLKAAIQSRDTERVRALLREDPGLARQRFADGGRPALLAIYYSVPDALAALVERGAELDAFEAAAAGDTGRVHALLVSDASVVGRRSHDGWTPLHLAAHFGRVDAMRLLVEHGADVHALSANAMANTPLHAAAAGGHAPAVAELLDRGADPNARQHGGYTALHSAAQSGRTDLARLLLDRGARVDLSSDDGKTPLALAEEKSRHDVAALLRERGAAGAPS